MGEWRCARAPRQVCAGEDLRRFLPWKLHAGLGPSQESRDTGLRDMDRSPKPSPGPGPSAAPMSPPAVGELPDGQVTDPIRCGAGVPDFPAGLPVPLPASHREPHGRLSRAPGASSCAGVCPGGGGRLGTKARERRLFRVLREAPSWPLLGAVMGRQPTSCPPSVQVCGLWGCELSGLSSGGPWRPHPAPCPPALGWR